MVTAETLQKLPAKLKPQSVEQDANAAVALILKPEKGDFEVLLVKRAVRAKDVWSGQMALPGGKREPQDATLRETAIRETFEETGINLAHSRFLGVLGAAKPLIGSGFLVIPFVFELEKTPQIVLNRTELESHMWVPYEKIAQSRGTIVVSHLGEVPAFMLPNAVVWGMTYQMLSEFAETVEHLKTQ
ncbi:MAG: CoA pyrophosphatase [Candidatus Bathyarchaeota archaeon]|nr:CoA pyrophosphatase [Candidatus Bathyarchaeota archaeon]